MPAQRGQKKTSNLVNSEVTPGVVVLGEFKGVEAQKVLEKITKLVPYVRSGQHASRLG